MTDEEMEFVRKVNIDKANNKTGIAIVLIVLSILTYIVPLVFGEFNFGIIFEGISLIFLLIAKMYMSEYNEVSSKKYIVCSLVAIGWILIYDAIRLVTYIYDAVDLAFLWYDYFFGEIFTILYIIRLFAINKNLSKADNPIKYKESTDWFYERDEKEK